MDALAMTNGAALAHPTMSGAEIKKWATVFVQSGYFKDVGDIAKAMVKIQAGQELGLPPMASMRGFDVVEGKVAPSAGLTAAMIKRSGRYRYEIEHSDAERCTLVWFENDQRIGTSEFTKEDAQTAGLWGRGAWKKYPVDMLFNRSLTRGARRFCADLFLGATYTPEELGMQGDPAEVEAVDAETGEVVEEVTGEIAEDHEERVPIAPPADDPAAEDEPEHWSPLIEGAADYSALQSLLGRIMRTDPSPRRFGAMKKCAERMANMGTVAELEETLGGLDEMDNAKPAYQGVPAIAGIMREAVDTLYSQAAQVAEATAEAVPA